MCKHFNATVEYLEERIPWDLFYIRLAVALDLDERERYLAYLLAGGKASKWQWSSSDHAGTESGNIVERLVNKFKGQSRTGDYADIAKPSERRIRAKYAVYDDGRRELVSYVWSDTGEELTEEELRSQGRVFMASRKLTAEEKRKNG